MKHLIAVLLLICSNALLAQEVNAHCPTICINDDRYVRGNVQLLWKHGNLRKGVKVVVTDNYGETILKKRFRWTEMAYYYDKDTYCIDWYVMLGNEKRAWYYVILSEDEEYDFWSCDIYENGWRYDYEE